MKTHILQLERYDDVTSVTDKITSSEANRVLLVWPRRGRVLERYLDLVLIQRACQKMGAQLACLVENEEVLDHAQELGIPVFRSVKMAQRMLWRRPWQKKIFEPKPRRPRRVFEELAQLARPKPAMEFNRVWLRISAFAIAIAAVVLAGLLIFPKAQIGLTLAQDQQVIELPVYASPELSVLNLSGGLPVQYLTVIVEGQDQQPATGGVSIGERVAQGRVQFTNLTDQAVEIPAGTRMETQGYAIVPFETLLAANLPAKPGSVIEVAIQALQPGSKGNVAAGSIQAIRGEIGAKVKVTNPAATAGGRDLQTTAVSAEDVLSLRQRLTAALQQKALVEFQARLVPGQRWFPETVQMVKVLHEEQTPALGAAAEQVGLSLQVEFRAWTIRDADVESLARLALDGSMPAGTKGLENTLQIQDSQKPELDQGQLHWQIRARRSVQASWDDHGIIRAVAGRSVADARQALEKQIHVIQPPAIKLNPAWWPFFPLLPGRITVVVQ